MQRKLASNLVGDGLVAEKGAFSFPLDKAAGGERNLEKYHSFIVLTL